MDVCQLQVLIARTLTLPLFGSLSLLPNPHTRPRDPLTLLHSNLSSINLSRKLQVQMDPSHSGPTIKKQEDEGEKRTDIKPAVKTLNRVPRKP